MAELVGTGVGLAVRRTLYRLMPCEVDKPRRIVVCVEVPVQRRWVVDLAEEGVLTDEPPDLGIEVACLGVEEAQLGVPLVAREREVVPRGGQLGRETEVTPNSWVGRFPDIGERLKLDAVFSLAAARSGEIIVASIETPDASFRLAAVAPKRAAHP